MSAPWAGCQQGPQACALVPPGTKASQSLGRCLLPVAEEEDRMGRKGSCQVLEQLLCHSDLGFLFCESSSVLVPL
jgi:hypothetical protein